MKKKFYSSGKTLGRQDPVVKSRERIGVSGHPHETRETQDRRQVSTDSLLAQLWEPTKVPSEI